LQIGLTGTRTSARDECGIERLGCSSTNGCKWKKVRTSRGKWTNDEWPSHRILNSNIKGHGHDMTKPKNFIVVDVPQSMANGQYLVNNVEDVMRVVSVWSFQQSVPESKHRK
jgi:hypothetical protein